MLLQITEAMDNLILSSIPLSQLEDCIGKIIEQKLQAYLPEQVNIPTSKRYATREQVSKLLHISLPTLNQLTKDGELIAYRIGNRVLYDLAEIDSSLNQITTMKYKRNTR